MDIHNSVSQSGVSVSSVAELKATWSDDPMKIVVMLFDKTLLHISRARASLSGWSNERYQDNILQAVDVLQLLQQTLNRNDSVTMAENMNDLYRYVSRVLIDSIHDQKPSQLSQASDLLMQIRESLSIFVKKSPKVLQH